MFWELLASWHQLYRAPYHISYSNQIIFWASTWTVSQLAGHTAYTHVPVQVHVYAKPKDCLLTTWKSVASRQVDCVFTMTGCNHQCKYHSFPIHNNVDHMTLATCVYSEWVNCSSHDRGGTPIYSYAIWNCYHSTHRGILHASSVGFLSSKQVWCKTSRAN